MSARAALGRPLALLALATALAAAATPAPVAAQAVPVVTDIVPDFDPGRDLGTTLSSNSGTHTIDGGTLAGANLFHSFASFSLAQGEIARWVQSTGDPASIAHVINRVTGGGTSFLSGTLDSSAIPNADFWFVNPAGIVFGTGAQVNVPAAAHFSTASGLNHVGGGRFEIATPDGSTLSVAPPESFGFVGGEADILISATNRIGSPGPLGLTAANIALQGASVLTSGLVLAAVGEDGGIVALDGSADRALTGQLTLVDAEANTIASARGAGDLAVNVGEVVLSNGQLGVFTIDATQGGDLTIDAARVGLLDGSRVVASSSVAAAGDSGGIRVSASESISVFDSSVQADAQGSGRGGDVLISAPAITFDNARLAALTFADGNGGNFSVRATGALTATDTSVFNSSLGTGATGDVLLHGGTVSLTRLFVGAQPSTIGGVGNVRGGVGDIRIVADGDLSITSGTITTETFGAGNAGDVSIAGGTISLTNVDITASTTNFFDSGPPGDAGSIDIAATGAVTFDNVNLSSAAEAECIDICPSGNAGSIAVRGSDVTVRDSSLRSEVFGNGNAGAIDLIASGTLNVSGSNLRSGAFTDQGELNDGGFAGAITLSGNDVTLAASSVSASTFGGDGGRVVIQAGNALTISASNLSSDTFGGGNAGGIGLSAASLTVNDGSSLSSDSFGSGDAGAIELFADSVTLDFAFLSSAAGSTGSAGSIDVLAETIVVRDSDLSSRTFYDDGSDLPPTDFSLGAAGSISLEAFDSIVVEGSEISSSAEGDGFAGSVTLRAPTIDLLAGSKISTDSDLTGVLGFIGFNSDRLTVDASTVSADTFNGLTANGTIGLNIFEGYEFNTPAQSVTLRNGAAIRTNTVGPGEGGAIFIVAKSVDLLDSMIQAQSLACGNGCGSGGPAGTITIAADALTVSGSDPDNRAAITSNTETSGAAGKIGLVGLGTDPSMLTLTGSQATISSQSSSTGDAGSIEIVMDRVEIADGGKITTTTSATASGQGGSIAITASDALVVRDGGKIEADTKFVCLSDDCGDSGKGGMIDIVTGALTLTGDGQADTTYIRANSQGTADAGQITLTVAGDLSASDAAYVSSDALGDGMSGGIAVTVGDTLLLESGAFLSSDVRGTGNAGNVMVEAKQIKLDAALISSNAADNSSGNAGTVTVTADSLDLLGSTIASTTGQNSMGNGGPITVKIADAALLDGASSISSDSSGSGRGGDVKITAGRKLDIVDLSLISADAFGQGRGGNVTVTAPSINLDFLGSISADSFGDGDSGQVSVSGSTIRLTDGSFISSDALGMGNSFLARVTASGELSLDGGSYISADVVGGNGGDVVVKAGTLRLSNGSFISSNVLPLTQSITLNGNAGDVSIDVVGLLELSSASITSNTGIDTTGMSGEVRVSAANIRLLTGSAIQSNTSGIGDAQGVQVTASGAISLDQGSRIESDARGIGNAGVVDIAAPEIRLTRASQISSDTFGFDDGEIETGNAGIVGIGVNRLSLADGSFISSDSLGDGDGGGVGIDNGKFGGSADLTLSSGSFISTDAFENGVAGFIILDIRNATLDNGIIRSESNSNDGGLLLLDVSGTLALGNRSQIRTNSTGAGPAGNIGVTADMITLSGQSTISSDAAGAGSAGQIGVTAGTIALAGQSAISSNSTGKGTAGDIGVTANTIALSGQSAISSAAILTSAGGSGTVDIVARDLLELSGVSAISTGSVNSNNAGRITLTAGQIDLIGSGLPNLRNNPANARITSSNSGTGSAGDITIKQTTPGLESGITLSEGAVITTSAGSGNAGQITIDMAPGTILRLIGRSENALIDTSTDKTGDAVGGKVFIGQTSQPYAVILNGGSILALGQTNQNNLDINANFLIRSADRQNRIAIGNGEEVDSQFEDVSSGIVSTNLDVVDASRVLSGACPAARARGEYSQFARRPIGPYAVEPPPDTVPEPPALPVSLNQTGTALASLVGARGCR